MKKHLLIKTTLTLAIALCLSSCVETIVAGSVATGVVLTQDKSVSDTKKDIIIAAVLDKRLAQAGLKSPTNKIGDTVNQQRVLLTGVVSDQKMIIKANEIAWKVSGVKEVIDEIQFSENKTFVGTTFGYIKDSLITTQINGKLLFNKKVGSSNFNVITVNNIVYIIGTSRNPRETSIVNDIAAKTVGVKKVISHIILYNDSRMED